MCRINDLRYIRKKMQREDAHKEDSRMSKESTAEEEESTHTTDIRHSAFQRSSEKRTKQRNLYTCVTSRTLAKESEKRLSSTVVLLSV